ncbi:MAG: mercury resistance system periplasmic binding protein MerP [Methylococcales bacterium]|nr:mercury resistance system periplasmic binding protein MerP [Methylococcales bacterium]
MKKLAFLLLLAQSGLLFAAEQSVMLSISGMTCAVCPITVKKSLQKVEGVKSVTVSYENKTAAVVFDDQLTKVESLLKATENVGYPATVLKNTP